MCEIHIYIYADSVSVYVTIFSSQFASTAFKVKQLNFNVTVANEFAIRLMKSTVCMENT